MKDDIKQKFINILFEPEDGEESVQETTEKAIIDSPIKAKDILYRKQGSSAFINYKDVTPTVNEENKDENYEFSSHISPIFGVIKEASKKTSTSFNKEVTETQTNKPESSHLDIITSPIYGYGSKEQAMEGNYEVKGIGEESDEELHRVFSDEDELLEQSFAQTEDEEVKEEENINLFNLFGDK